MSRKFIEPNELLIIALFVIPAISIAPCPPEIEAPPGIDINQAGQAMLQIMGMTPEEAQAFSNRVDWATTLVVPVPQGADYRSITVDGVDGVLLEDTYAGGNARFTMLWVKDGMFYALSGDGTRYSPIRIGNSME